MRGKLTWLHRRTAGKVHGGPDMRKGYARRDSLIAAIFEAIPSPAFIVDKDVRIVDFNGAAAAVLPAGGKGGSGKRGGGCASLHPGDGNGGRVRSRARLPGLRDPQCRHERGLGREEPTGQERDEPALQWVRQGNRSSRHGLPVRPWRDFVRVPSARGRERTGPAPKTSPRLRVVPEDPDGKELLGGPGGGLQVPIRREWAPPHLRGLRVESDPGGSGGSSIAPAPLREDRRRRGKHGTDGGHSGCDFRNKQIT